MIPRDEAPKRILGVNFSVKADETGRDTWIADGIVEDGRLHVTDCRCVSDRLDVPPDRMRAISALTAFLGRQPQRCAIGLDFPFGLPTAVVPCTNWTAFVRRFPDWFTMPETLTAVCTVRAELTSNGTETEPPRATDKPLGSIAPYSERLAEETFFGIRDVLRPLVLTDAVRVLPMQAADADRPWLLEVYPAGTLSDLDGQRYRTPEQQQSRDGRPNPNVHVERLREAGVVLDDAAECAVDSPMSAPLDSILAAYATFRNTRDANNLRTDDERRAIEGYIYV
ncbi:MAG: hypothetical protein ACQETI_04415 [Halobacteriota archaeon]